jgi:hypothetical protein
MRVIMQVVLKDALLIDDIHPDLPGAMKDFLTVDKDPDMADLPFLI